MGDLLRILFARKWVLCAITLAVGAASAWVTVSGPRTYEYRRIIEVGSIPVGSTEPELSRSVFASTRLFIQSLIESPSRSLRARIETDYVPALAALPGPESQVDVEVDIPAVANIVILRANCAHDRADACNGALDWIAQRVLSEHARLIEGIQNQLNAFESDARARQRLVEEGLSVMRERKQKLAMNSESLARRIESLAANMRRVERERERAESRREDTAFVLPMLVERAGELQDLLDELTFRRDVTNPEQGLEIERKRLDLEREKAEIELELGLIGYQQTYFTPTIVRGEREPLRSSGLSLRAALLLSAIAAILAGVLGTFAVEFVSRARKGAGRAPE